MRSAVLTGNVFTDLAIMHTKYGFNKRLDEPGLVNRLQFLEEELAETELAAYQMDPEALVDGLIDLIVVAAGTLNMLIGEVDSQTAWNKVMAANMQKEVGSNAHRPNSNGVDLVKPEGWKKPDLKHESVEVAEVFSDFNMSWFRELLVDNNKLAGVMSGAGTRTSELLKVLSGLVPEPAEAPVSLVPDDRGAVTVLQECMDVMRKKSRDYANPNSSVRQADYYPDGFRTIQYMADTLKGNRMLSLMESIQQAKLEGRDYSPENESLEDTIKDRINYLAIGVEWLRGETEGQNLDEDRLLGSLGETT